MTRTPTCNYSLCVIAPFIVILTLLFGAAVLAHVTGAGQPSEKSNAARAQSGAAAPAQTAGSLMPWTDGVGRLPVGSSQTKRHGERPMDSNPPLFLPAVAYDSGGSYATSVAVADLNRDGNPDLVVANQNSATVGVLLGNGDGTFQPAAAYASGGGSPGSVAVADVNGDRVPDVIVVNAGSSSAGVLLGNGDGTFQPAAVYDSGGYFATSLAVADFNGDGTPDLVITNWYDANKLCCSSPTLGVLLGNGDGTFQPAVTYGEGAEVWVAVGDFNHDHRPDLVVAYDFGYVEILLGNGDGTFQTPATYSTGASLSISGTIADLNRDSKLDLAMANGDLNNVVQPLSIFLGNGDGAFQQALTYDLGVYAVSAAAADVDGDGNPDLVLAVAVSGVDVLLGNGDGTFQAGLIYDSGGSPCISAVATDVNGDGRPDVVAVNGGGSAVGVLLNNTGPHSSTTTTLASAPNPSVFGQLVSFTVVVSSSSGTPTGVVELFEDSTTLGRATLTHGTASIPLASLAAGSHSITAVYSGSTAFNPSTSDLLNQVVTVADTATSLASSRNPGVVSQPITYSATVITQYGGALAGTVTFQDGGVTIATVSLVGNQAAYTTKYQVQGTHTITATYSGDTNNAGSASSPLVEQINKGFASKTVVSTSGSPSLAGQPVTFTATVTSTHGAIPDSELVTFYDGKATLSSVALAGGTAAYTTSALSGKTHTIKAAYGGDATFKPSTGRVTQVVNRYPTNTALSSSPNPSAYGQAVTFTATITSTGPYQPTGKVRLLDGTTVIGSATLSGGVATLTRSKLAVGTHPITAQYLGDAASAQSTSSVLDQVVQ